MVPKISYRARCRNFSYYLQFENGCGSRGRDAHALDNCRLCHRDHRHQLARDMLLGEAFLGPGSVEDTFGLILTILILLEFNHSVYVA